MPWYGKPLNEATTRIEGTNRGILTALRAQDRGAESDALKKIRPILSAGDRGRLERMESKGSCNFLIWRTLTWLVPTRTSVTNGAAALACAIFRFLRRPHDEILSTETVHAYMHSPSRTRWMGLAEDHC